jgi:hypothetical protein
MAGRKTFLTLERAADTLWRTDLAERALLWTLALR